MRHTVRRLWVALAVTSIALASSARAQVDVSGPWAVRNDVLGFDIGMFHQTDTSLSATIWDAAGQAASTPPRGLSC